MFKTKDITKFHSKYKKNVENGCWEWTGALQKPGDRKQLPYAIFGNSWKQMQGHRASWIIHNGVIPKGLLVLHNCDNPKCVNPEHLRLGTYKDNMQDRVKRGRFKAATGPIKRISFADASMIRVLGSYCSRKAVSEYTGFSIYVVDSVLTGKTRSGPIPNTRHLLKKYPPVK